MLRCAGVRRSFVGPRGAIDVLRGVDLRVEPGEVVAILGPSGSGKSTLLHILAGLDGIDGPAGTGSRAGDDVAAGEVWWGDVPVHDVAPRRLGHRRAEHVGLVFQNHYLLEELSALENVTLPGRIRGSVDVARGERLLRAVGLEQRAEHRPRKLSGGERQRVAVARALYSRPPLVLADEPTGSLDRATAEQVYASLLGAAEREGAAVVVTHDEHLVEGSARRLELENGRLRARS